MHVERHVFSAGSARQLVLHVVIIERQAFPAGFACRSIERHAFKFQLKKHTVLHGDLSTTCILS